MKQPTKPFALCVDNTDYKASLIPGKVYRIIPDPRAAKDDFVRIVDESGEDYLYHRSHFLFVDFPRAVTKRNPRLGTRQLTRAQSGRLEALHFVVWRCAARVIATVSL